MKLIKSVIVLSMVLLLSVNVFASSLPVKGSVDYEKVELNLLEGVKSDNSGLKINSAYHLGELKSEKSVIPLLGMLHSADTEEERIAAALSLSKISTTKSLYFVKEAAKFDDSRRVRELCKKFYLNAVKS